MSSNIKHEAVFPPALYSLRRMTQQSPSRNTSKGSYELYDSHQNAVDIYGEKTVNGISGSAPGSPGSFHDYKQAVVNLQRELEESQKKGSELRQIVAGLTSPQTHSSESFADSQFLEASSSNDSLGENVKDAHIKHLQRQVTVLQANLYKSEGWANRVASAIKERDKAMEEVTRLTNQIKNLQGDNQQMLQKIENLGVALEETQQNLRQVTEELQSQLYNGHILSQLKEEAQRQKCEISTLKESLSRLDQENRNLKDSGVEVGSQSLGGSLTCSQELEHLHSVVDKLKNTVLEQRTYLLHMKKPSMRNAKSMSLTSSAGSILTQDVIMGRKLSSPTLMTSGVGSAGDGVAMGNLQQLGFGHPNQAAAVKSTTLKEHLFNARQQILNSPDYSQGEVIGTSRKLNSRDMLDDVFNLDDLNSPHPLPTHGDGCGGLKPGSTPYVGGAVYSVRSISQRSPECFTQQGSGDMGEKSPGQMILSTAGGNLPAKSPQHRATQSEIISSRGAAGKANQEHWGSRSEVIGRQAWQLNQASSSKSPAFTYKPSGYEVDKLSQQSPGLPLNQGQGYLAVTKPQQETESNVYKGSYMHKESQRQLLNGSTIQMCADNKGASQFENVNRNSPTFHAQQIYHPPSSCQEGSVEDMMTSGKPTVPGPPAHQSPCQRSGHEVLYVNTAAEQGLSASNTSSSVDPDPSRSRLNSNRICPVCSHDYSQVSMEEFQTHVFECFDNENSPQTMMPQTSPDKMCPLCQARFGSETSQVEFEKHVHGHFGEDCLVENFEILQP